MVSRYRGGYAVRGSPPWWGISPHIGHQVVEIRDRIAPFSPPIPEYVCSFRENGSHAQLPVVDVPRDKPRSLRRARRGAAERRRKRRGLQGVVEHDRRQLLAEHSGHCHPLLYALLGF